MTTTHLRNGLLRLRPLPPTHQLPFDAQRITRATTSEIVRSSSSLPPSSTINTNHPRTNHHQQPHNRSLSHHRPTTSNRRPQQQQQQQQQSPYRRPTFYGTKTIVRASHRPHPPYHPLSPYIATCLRHLPADQSSSPNSAVPDSDMSFNVLFLGTGAGGRPSTFRSLSATALRLSGRTFLFDCGEGLQRQMAFGNLGPGEVEKVFVTHLHGDHVSGLLGLVCSVMIARTSAREAERNVKRGRSRSGSSGSRGSKNRFSSTAAAATQAPLEIYGPPGLYNYLAMNLALTCTALHIDIIVYELVGGNDEEGPHSKPNQQRRPGRGRNGSFNVWTGRYPEFDHPRLSRKTIPRDSNGRWTLLDKNHNDQNNHNKRNNTTPSRDPYNRTLRYHIEAGELRHRPGVQTFGYVVREPQPQPTIDVDKCLKVGLKPGPKLRILKAGKSVRNDNPPVDPNNGHTKEEGVEYDAEGYRIVHPHEVLVEREVRPSRGRTFGLVADTFRLSEGMKELVKGVDVLVHEATIREEDCVDRSRSIERGHSTPSMAGAVARAANAKVLLLNHVAGSIDDLSDSDQHSSLIKHAERSNGGVSQVAVAYDFMEFRVPRRGYDFEFEDEK